MAVPTSRPAVSLRDRATSAAPRRSSAAARVAGEGETSTALGPSLLLDLQRQVGNRAVTALVGSAPRPAPPTNAPRPAAPTSAPRPAAPTSAPRPAPPTNAPRPAPPTNAPRPAALADVHAAARPSGGVTPMFAGATAGLPPPGGLATIDGRTAGGFNPGYTGIQHSGSFTAPTVSTRATFRREEVEGRSYPVVRHFAVFEPTSATDATHESLYPAPGLHRVPAFQRTYRVSPEISNCIRLGEQEHLNDAQRAYDLTYGRVVEVVNRLAARGVEFGPADNPQDAETRAMRRLAQLLGPLGNEPRRWRELLDQLLSMSTLRDTRMWHTFTSELGHEGRRQVHDVVAGDQANIGVPSEQVVNLPGGAAGAGGAGTQPAGGAGTQPAGGAGTQPAGGAGGAGATAGPAACGAGSRSGGTRDQAGGAATTGTSAPNPARPEPTSPYEGGRGVHAGRYGTQLP